MEKYFLKFFLLPSSVFYIDGTYLPPIQLLLLLQQLLLLLVVPVYYMCILYTGTIQVYRYTWNSSKKIKKKLIVFCCVWYGISQWHSTSTTEFFDKFDMTFYMHCTIFRTLSPLLYYVCIWEENGRGMGGTVKFFKKV